LLLSGKARAFWREIFCRDFLLSRRRDPFRYHFLKFTSAERFWQVVVHSGRKALFPRFLNSVSGKSNDRRLAPARLGFHFPNLPGRFEAVHKRHLTIHQNKIKGLLPHLLYGLFSILNRLHGKPVNFQNVLREYPVEIVVFCKENALGLCRGFIRSWYWIGVDPVR